MNAFLPVVLALALVHTSVHEARAAATATPAPLTKIQIDDPALQALVDRFAPTLASNEKRFDGRTGPVRGFGAGATYPQIWIRDSATLVDLARFHFSHEHLTSWIEEHLAHQQLDGALFDWIAAGPPSSFAEWAPQVRLVHRSGAVQISADKNTVEADQESSAVAAVADIFAFRHDVAWLKRKIAGRALLDRCDAALSFLLRERRDRETGLVISGFAADWGDVSPTYGDQRAIYLDDKTPQVVGLYTNALAYRAGRGLANMHAAVGDTKRSAHWQAEMAALKSAAERMLWQPQRGFFRMHAPVSGSPFKASDAQILAMGGHAVAVRAGLIAGSRARGVLDALEAKRRELKLSTASFTLLPPFPAGLFQHPAVKEPWAYQNGGQWDWFGGRLVLAEFEHGRAARARTHLLELAQKAAKSGGLFEWHTRAGEGRGSPQYAGSAGALGAAVLQGLLGVRLSGDRAELRPRAGTTRVRATLFEPASGATVDYDYRLAGRELTFAFGVSPPRPSTIAVLLPRDWRTVDARLDDRAVETEVETIGSDRYAVLEAEGGAHRLVITPAKSKSRPRRRSN